MRSKMGPVNLHTLGLQMCSKGAEKKKVEWS